MFKGSVKHCVGVKYNMPTLQKLCSSIIAFRVSKLHYRAIQSTPKSDFCRPQEGLFRGLSRKSCMESYTVLKRARAARTQQGSYAEQIDIKILRLEREESLAQLFIIDESSIGSGTYGTVYRATCKKTGEMAAIKCMNKSEQLHYHREINMMRRVNFKGCLRLNQVLETNEKVFLVMELLEGGDLFDHIVDNNVYLGNLSVRETLQFTRAMLCSLEACHIKNFAHLDVKPENFVFRSPKKDANDLVLVDFGAAQPFRLRPFARNKTQYIGGMDDYWIGTPESHIGGTASYVSPEVIVDGRFSSRSDVWSMGVTLYMMLTGQRPFEVEYQLATDRCKQEKEIRGKIRAEAAGARNNSVFKTCKDLETIHPRVKRLLEELTQPDPALRPSTTEAIHYIDILLKDI